MLIHILLVRIREQNLVGQRLVLAGQMLLWHATDAPLACAGSELRHVIVKWDGLVKIHLH